MTNPTGDALKASAAQVEQLAKAFALDNYPDTRWPDDENDADYGACDREGRYPVSWHFANKCRSQARIAIAALSPVEQAPQPVAAEFYQVGWLSDPALEPTSYSFTKSQDRNDFQVPCYVRKPSPSPETHVTVVTVEFCQKVIAEQNRIIGELQAELDKGKTP